MKLHTAGEDYLEAVLILQKKLGMVRSVDVARYMEVSKPSVCYAVGTLREGGFLTTDEKHYSCLCRAIRPVRHDPVASPQDGTPTKQASDYNQAAKQAWQLVGDEAQAGLKILAH